MENSFSTPPHLLFLAASYDLHAVLFSGCKESQFYSLPFGQAVASMY